MINAADILPAILVILVMGMIVYFSPLRGKLVNRWFRKKRDITSLEHWAEMHSFTVHQGYTMWNIADRFRANPGKSFFQAEKYMMERDMDVVVDGQIESRRVWVYPIVAKTFPGSAMGFSREYVTGVRREYNRFVGHGAEYNTRGNVRVFSGWCVEISSKHIPQNIILTKKYFVAPDIIDTESRDFEKIYDVHGTQDSMVLQLLDPVLMQQAIDSTAAAIEISDASVVLYYTQEHIPYDVLEAYLQHGLVIAEQVDRNFPKAS